MSTPQVISAVTTGSVASSAVTSTKVRVSTNAGAVYYAVGTNPTAYSGNCEIIPSESTRFVNMQGLGNKIAFLAVSSNTSVSVQQIGTVAASGIGN